MNVSIRIYTSIENHHRGGFGDCGNGGTSGLFENANNIGFLWASEPPKMGGRNRLLQVAREEK